MTRRNAPFLRALLLLILTAGPLQAQTVFACAMMETVVHDACCCGEHVGDASIAESSNVPCCERSVEVRVGSEAGQTTSVGKPAEIRSDADPPQPPVASIDALAAPGPPPQPAFFQQIPAAALAASETWLVTLRLRI